MLVAQHNMQATQPPCLDDIKSDQPAKLPVPLPRKKRRKGKGAKARERRQARAAQEAAEKEAKEEKRQTLEKQKAQLDLKKGDVVITVPSDRFPEPVELTVNNLVFNPNRGDWMVTFDNGGSNHAWLNNLGRTYYKKDD